MKYSKLSDEILNCAENIRKAKGVQFVSAPCIVAAVAEFCKTEYRGITEYDSLCFPEWYEEERVRYIFRKVFKGSSNIVGKYFIDHMSKEYSIYDKDFLSGNEDALNKLSETRGKYLLSADLIFLFAVSNIRSEHRPSAYPQFKGDFSVLEKMSDIDKNIYDYVIEETGKLAQKLLTKAESARAKRDWKPAAKFSEPEELEQLFYNNVQLQWNSKNFKMILPYFFGTEDGRLELDIRFAGGIYYIHDNGNALKQLAKNTVTREKYKEVLSKISNNLSFDGDKIVGDFSQGYTFFHYLQILIFVAHGDLYYENLCEEGLNSDSDCEFIEEAFAEDFPKEDFVTMIKDIIKFGYDENTGLYISMGMTYSLNSSWVSYQIETLDENCIRISDRKKGKMEGEIFESFYWGNDDISVHSEYINKFCERFGAEFDGKDISITSGKNEFVRSLYNFINLAVLLSEFGRIH